VLPVCFLTPPISSPPSKAALPPRAIISPLMYDVEEIEENNNR
jgi:hypothetical protein